MDLSTTEKKPVSDDTKKEIWECYNYGVKEYLTKDYQRLKAELGSQEKTAGTEKIF